MRTFILLLSLMISTGAFAAEKTRRSDRVKHTSSAPAYGGSSYNLIAVGVSDTFWVSSGESASAMFSLSHDWIQTYLGVFKTKGDVDFAVGGAYKFTVAGTRSTGFHVGPGFMLGTVGGDFAWAIFGAAGGHFSISDHLLIAVDAGPMVTHTANNTNFRLRPMGQLLGLSAFYVF